jgi:hypothetical protein
MLASAQKEQMRQTLINRRSELEAAQAVLNAEIAHLKYKIAEAEGSAEAEALKEEAQDAWVDAHAKANAVLNENNAKLNTAMVGQFSSAFATIGERYNKLITGMNGEEFSPEQIKELREYWEAEIKKLDFTEYDKTLADTNVVELKSRLTAALKLAAVSVEKNGLPVPHPKMQMRSFSICLTALFLI